MALLVGCAIRRNELAELDVPTIQQREGRWVLADLEGVLLFKLCGTLLCSLFGAPIADQGVKRCGEGTSRGNMKLRALPRISRITPGTILCQII